MRGAVLELAFAQLGAEAAHSGVIEGNDASLGVSRKLGYQEVGTTTVSPRGKPVTERRLRLERADWRPSIPVEIEGFETVRSLFGV
jgi:RimJ/RimL family protein N-acetyltransferase